MKLLSLAFSIFLFIFIPSSFAVAECIDTEPIGDGWGVDGNNKCRLRRIRRQRPAPSVLQLLSVDTINVGARSAKIDAKFSEPSKVTIRFGKTQALQKSGPYQGFLFLENYRQTLSNLEPDTIYYYKLIATNRYQKSKVESDILSFKTLPVSDVTTTTNITTTTKSPTTQLNILFTDVHSFADGKIKVRFDFETARPAFIRYGTTEDNLDSKGTVELSSRIDHNQTLSNIANDTKYYYRIVSNSIESELFSFTTDGSDTPTTTTKPSSDGSCTSGVGKLYGASSHMSTLANMKNWTNGYLAIAFTNVDHTKIDSIKVHTTSRTPSYYQGNGGKFRLFIYSDDGNGKPDRQLAQTPEYIGATSLKGTSGPWSSRSQAESTYPGAIWSSYGETGKELEYHRRFKLSSSLSVTPGTRYHIVMRRTTSTAHGTSLNGFLTGRLDKNDDPFFPVGDWLIHNSSSGNPGSWSLIPHKGIFEVYGDGSIIGNAHHEIAAFSDADRSNNVNGSSAARQVWVPHKTMQIARLRVQAGRRNGSAPLNYQIKNSSGTVLRSGSIAGFPTLTGNDIRATPRLSQRRSSDFSPLQVIAGQKYYIEFKTSSGTHYEISMTRDGVLSGYYNVDPNHHGWGSSSLAEVSYNNGSSWVLPTNWSNPRDYLSIQADVGEYANGDTSCLENQ